MESLYSDLYNRKVNVTKEKNKKLDVNSEALPQIEGEMEEALKQIKDGKSGGG